ncbi:FAD-dependent oxidoreductase [Maribacter sp. 2210JD10-5]|uniref:FAD-dependent oxidoreductase n=1 Tax=Maribacter sp. 2210JD10-5 TaxID=3386272 RepID=UPI0039BC3272
MKTSIHIDAYKVPIVHRPDVCVVGGGAAGISAAIAAARTGKKVLLIEKYGFCGGATVAGLSGTICGLFNSGDVKREQIVFGFADEFYSKLKQRNGVVKPVDFGKTCLIPHDGLVWKELADDLLQSENIEIRYHTNFLKAITDESGKVTALIVKSFEGQFAICSEVVVDASGDAEIIHNIEGETYSGASGTVQTPTMIFKMGHVDMEVFLKTSPESICEKVEEADKAGDFKLPRHHVYAFPLPNKNEVICNMTRITYPDGTTPLGISSEDMTYAEIEGRKQAREYADFLIERISAFKDAYMVDTGAQVGIRQSRSIVGHHQLMNEEVYNAKKSKSAISHSAWPIEAHGSGDLKIVYLENDHYDIPFETLQPTIGNNILVAGRCMSAEHEALASARVTGQCFGMGYAIGAAVSLMLDERIASQKLKGEDVLYYMKQHQLKNSYE